MRDHISFRAFAAGVAAAAVLLVVSAAGAGICEQLPSLPDKEGFAGCYAGVSGGALLVAGGANFPDRKPWEGGQKVWSDAVFVLEGRDAQWKVGGRLRRPLGYGVSVTCRGGVVCAGGGDAERNSSGVFRLKWRAGRLEVVELPPLPRPVANACGALLGDMLYVMGGQEDPTAPTALSTVFRIDLGSARPEWTEVETWPGPGRMLATAASFDGKIWLIGGVDLVPGGDGKAVRRYLQDAYCYDPSFGWKRIPDLPIPVAAAPSPAPVDAGGFEILGGDDGSQVGVAPDQHPGFVKKILRHEAAAGGWVDGGRLPVSRVTTPCVRWGESWVIPSGEDRPGVRSPEVWRFAPGKE